MSKAPDQISEEQRARNRAEHEAARGAALAAARRRAPSPMVLGLGALIISLFGYVLWSMWGAGEFRPRAAETVMSPEQVADLCRARAETELTRPAQWSQGGSTGAVLTMSNDFGQAVWSDETSQGEGMYGATCFVKDGQIVKFVVD